MKFQSIFGPKLISFCKISVFLIALLLLVSANFSNNVVKGTDTSGPLSITLASSQTLQEITISSNTTITSDLSCSSLTIQQGVALTTNGFSIICSGFFTNDGTVITGYFKNGGEYSRNGGSCPNSYGGSGGGAGYNIINGGNGGATFGSGRIWRIPTKWYEL